MTSRGVWLMRLTLSCLTLYFQCLPVSDLHFYYSCHPPGETLTNAVAAQKECRSAARFFAACKQIATIWRGFALRVGQSQREGEITMLCAAHKPDFDFVGQNSCRSCRCWMSHLRCGQVEVHLPGWCAPWTCFVVLSLAWSSDCGHTTLVCDALRLSATCNASAVDRSKCRLSASALAALGASIPLKLQFVNAR